MMPNYWCPFMSKDTSRKNIFQQPGQMIPGQGQVMPGQMIPNQMLPGQMIPGQGQVMPGQMIPNQMLPGQMQPVQLPPGITCPGFMQGIPQLFQSQGIHMPPGTGMMETYDMDSMLFDIDDDMDDMDDDIDANGTTSDPPPVLSDNPALTSVVLFKELSGYPNYGNPSGNADILYTGNRGVWTFQIPAYLFVPGALRAQLFIRAVLDDHYNVPVDRYSARITINGTQVHTGHVPLEHGRPAGEKFTNWRLLTFNVPNLRRNNRVVIVNTSNTGTNDWIGLDWMEMRLNPSR